MGNSTHHSLPPDTCSNGFSLIELIVILIIVGIISFFASSRFVNRTSFDELGFFEESITAVRYAQKLAITSGCDVQVTINSSGYILEQWGNTATNECDFDDAGVSLSNVRKPGGGNFSGTAPSGVSITVAPNPTVWFFDQIGIPRTTGGVEITMETTATIGSRTLSVAPHTGFTRCTTGC